MTTDITFAHPAHDPPAAVTARARERVAQTIRRRRARRRTVGSAALVAVVGAGTAGIAALNGGGSGGGGGSGREGDVVADDGRQPGDVQADTEWSDPVLSRDGRTLTIQVGHSPPGDTPCDQNFTHELIETDDAVTVAFDEQPVPPPAEGDDDVACEDMLEPQTFEVALAAPLGDRTVHDGVRPEPLVVHRMAELVDVSFVPDGFTPQGPVYDETGTGWQQVFTGDGADWYFSVGQQPEASASPVVEGTPIPVTVHGIEGQRYRGQMNGTMETIRWTEDGVTLTVWGEMQGPPTFTRSTELLAIAEGVRLPTP